MVSLLDPRPIEPLINQAIDRVEPAVYPSSGTLVITKGALTETITFSSATATTGQVTVTIGKKTTMVTLPKYGSCG